MAFSQAQDRPTLPTTNPASTGIFSGNQNNPNMNIDPPIIPPLLPPPPMRTSHTRVRHYRERYGAHQNNQQNDDPAGSGNTQQTNYPAGTYGLPPDIQEMDEPMPRPAVIIKEPDLRYEGDNFEDFLERFELAAEIYGAGGYDKARQVCRFVKVEELKKELESMDGYEQRNWTLLRASMIEIWGGVAKKIRYTIKDLYNLIDFCQKKGGIKQLNDFKTYQSKFMMITKYLTSINQELVKADLIPTGKDGYNKPPLLSDVIDVAEDEIRARSLNVFAASGFAEANQSMQRTLDQKKGDGKKREKMMDDNPPEVLQKQVDSLAKAIESLTGKLENQPKNEYSRGNDQPSGRLYEPRPCYCCHKEGHSTIMCYEAQKDEREGLVKKQGRDFYLPNGKKIPWDPSRPIRVVVAADSAKPKPQITKVYRTDHPSVFEQQAEPTPNSNDYVSSMHKIDWNPPHLGSENFDKVKSNAATTRAEALRGRRKPMAANDDSAMDLDPIDELEEIVEEVAATRKTPGQIAEPQAKPTVQKTEKTVESALVSELDNLKIPTTFSQLTSISPTYAQEVIKKLQKQIPEHKNSKFTYVKGPKQDSKVSASMLLNPEEEDQDYNCFYSCALGFIETHISGKRVPFMVDSGSMVNVIPRQAAIDLNLEVIEVDIPMKGIGGDRCDIKGVVENCAISIGRFTGPVHLFVSPHAQDCILGRPFLFDYDCTLDYPGTGELLSFQGNSGRHITVPIAKIGQGKGWNQMKNLIPVGTAYTKAYQTQDTVQSHFSDDSDFTIKPSLVQRKLKWVKKICHLVKNKTSKEKLCGPNDQLHGTDDGLQGTNDGLHGTDDELHRTDDGLHGTDDGLHGTDDGLHRTNDGLYGTNNGNSSYNNQTTRSGGRMESGISKRNGNTNGTCTYSN
ncbi:hypothetical protein PGT21_009509 [Puccinia graminis f. sp. tritici]|uniref:Peptidase A2 domain-containing protein n=1 Tax=Puccinia graminis f. sp. tritici TaxID=56615 RepID=A0A5B0LVS1_PUCGR|nr:hypothetical protein PGT21_009471 [Puccinia graminis f. sp. tritici]KAA1069027.1 hypothetical protein PGT21_009509 [Puccinia graminis f. sp. tritici]